MLDDLFTKQNIEILLVTKNVYNMSCHNHNNTIKSWIKEYQSY